MIDDRAEWEKGQGLNALRGGGVESMEILDSFFGIF
jgi:hypothetical protein